jgi:hypothetical protein
MDTVKQVLSDGTKVRTAEVFKLDDVAFVRLNNGEREMPMRKFHFLGGIVALFHTHTDWRAKHQKGCFYTWA